jgi:hypothetical protein
MKRITLLVVQLLVIVLIGSGALANNLQAQSDRAITVRVPFAFILGTQSLAPGTYRFSQNSGPFLLSVINVKTGNQELFEVRPERQSALEAHGHIIFHNSEASSVLDEVHFPGIDTFSKVTQRRGAGRIEAKKSSPNNSISVGQR